MKPKIVKNKKLEIIINALEGALYLLGEEYQTLVDKDLKGEYDRVIAGLEEAAKMVKDFD